MKNEVSQRDFVRLRKSASSWLLRYLALKHGLALPTESDGGIVATLTAMGVDTDGLFNSLFLVK